MIDYYASARCSAVKGGGPVADHLAVIAVPMDLHNLQRTATDIETEDWFVCVE